MTTHNLPHLSTPFIGRAQELREIAALLADPNCRLLTLVGPGGIGKTRLALQAAPDQLPSYAHGVYFVPLTSVSSPNWIASAIGNALQLSFYSPEDLRVQILRYLREKQLLLVMDNFEHLLEGVGLLTDLLESAAGVKLLVTSRERLNVQEEWVLVLDGLPFPEAHANAPLESYNAVQLFVQRAHQVQPNFSLNENVEAVKAICQRVEGMPLGLELAATWLRAMSCRQIAAHMEGSLDFLTTPLRNVPERHRSLRAVFEQSWNLLTASEQDVLMRLSIFQGSFDLEAAEQVAGASLAILAGLTDKSLVRLNIAGRYDLHELLRQYGEGRLSAAGESDAARASHSAYYMDYLAQRDEDIKGRRQQAALREIKLDFENIRVAWTWAVEQRHYSAISRALDCLVNATEMTLNLLDTQTILQQTVTALAPASDGSDDPVWDQIAIRYERVRHLLGGEINHELVETILKRTRERSSDYELTYCLWVSVDDAARRVDPATQLARYEECLALQRRVGDEFYVAHTLVGSFDAFIARNEVERGLDCLRESVRIRRRLGDQNNLPLPLFFLAHWLSQGGRFAEAETLLVEALAIQDEIGQVAIYGSIQGFVGVLAFWRGDFARANAHIEAGLDFSMEQPIEAELVVLKAQQSYLVSIEGDYQRGRDLCEQHFSHMLGDVSAAYVEWGLVLAYCGLSNDEAARRALQNTLQIASGSLHLPVIQQLCLPFAAILAARAGHSERAVELLGLTYTLPAELTGWMDHWTLLAQLRSELEAELGVQIYAAAWAHGQVLVLDAVVADLRVQFQVSSDTSQPEADLTLSRSLTLRETEVLRLVAAGRSNQQIAEELVISLGTVKWYISQVYDKLDVRSRTQAIARGRALKMLP